MQLFARQRFPRKVHARLDILNGDFRSDPELSGV
jgi:hypothetical protein